MPRRSALLALAVLAGMTLSGCYALDPEMRRVVAQRKAAERAAKEAPTKQAPSEPAMAVTILPQTVLPPPMPAPAGADAALDPAVAAVARHTLDSVAHDYVGLVLELGTHNKSDIDAYYGPKALMAAAVTDPRSLARLGEAARQLSASLDDVAPHLTAAADQRRLRALKAMLLAAETRSEMLQGKRFAFADEAERLFGVRPTLEPLSAYDATLATIAQLVPGGGELADRVEAYFDRFTIPAARLKPTFDAAIAQCRARTAAQVAMPEGENFDLQFVTGKSWSGYNFYMGGYRSIIQVNTDLPIRLSRALDLGCHEGYPGHHLFNLQIEAKLVRDRNWIEYSVYPLYSPQSFLAEGSANYGIDLAFPADERIAVERGTIMPLAGIEPPADERYWQLLDAMKALSGARLTIAQQYLDGAIDRPTAVALTQKYGLVSRPRAEQMTDFTEKYRSYVINYGLGEAMVRDYVERGAPSRDMMWRRFLGLLGEPTLPADLAAQ